MTDASGSESLSAVEQSVVDGVLQQDRIRDAVTAARASRVAPAEGAAEGQQRTEPAAGEQQPPSAPAAPQESAEGEKRGNAEAAKYRTQLRSAEATIADHQAHIAELQEYVIEGMIADRVADPKVFAKLVDREAWAGEDGRIDVPKLDAAVSQLLEDHPALKATKPMTRVRPKPNEGERTGTSRPVEKQSALERAFGDSGRRWSHVVGSRGRAGVEGVEAKTGKVRLEVSRNQDQ